MSVVNTAATFGLFPTPSLKKKNSAWKSFSYFSKKHFDFYFIMELSKPKNCSYFPQVFFIFQNGTLQHQAPKRGVLCASVHLAVVFYYQNSLSNSGVYLISEINDVGFSLYALANHDHMHPGLFLWTKGKQHRSQPKI